MTDDYIYCEDELCEEFFTLLDELCAALSPHGVLPSELYLHPYTLQTLMDRAGFRDRVGVCERGKLHIRGMIIKSTLDEPQMWVVVGGPSSSRSFDHVERQNTTLPWLYCDIWVSHQTQVVAQGVLTKLSIREIA